MESFLFLFPLFMFWYGRVKGTGPPHRVMRSCYHSPLLLLSQSFMLAHVARVVDKEFDCRERWVRVDGLVCGLVYASCLDTTREER